MSAAALSPTPPSRRSRRPSRDGFTLLELLLVVTLLGVSAGLAVFSGPAALGAFARQSAPADSPNALIAEARRTAITRGQPLQLAVTSDGRWRLATLAGDSLAAGALRLTASASRPFTLRIDPLGSCRSDEIAAGPTFDPVRCRWNTDGARVP